MPQLKPFHLAIPVHNVEIAEKFYTEHFNCQVGRRADTWVDLNFFGHQLVLHFDAAAHAQVSAPELSNQIENAVDGHNVPVPHHGVVLGMEEWQELADNLVAKNTKFVIEPYLRFKGKKGEQATMFLYDPSGNALEFKAFADESMLFESFDDQCCSKNVAAADFSLN